MNSLIFVLAILVFGVWALFGIKQMKHKVFAFLVILVLIFSFFSFNMVFKDGNFSIKSFSDVENVAKVYFSWLGNAFNNFKILTTQAIKMNWAGNQTT